MRHLQVLGILLCVVSGVSTAVAVETLHPNDALICQDDPVKLDPARYLRALSLDLRGHPPTMEEIESLDGVDANDPLPDALIESWLDEDSFIKQAVRRHRTFFWNNLRNVDFINRNKRLGVNGGIYWNNIRSRLLRTGSRDQVICYDEPAQFDADGMPVTRQDESGYNREGWVEVSPYWAPDTVVRVCAFDAQERRYSANGADCATAAGANRTDCGCGPDLRWCAPTPVTNTLLDSMGRSLERLIESVIAGDGGYRQLFESRDGFINGPMVHYYRHLSGSTDIQSKPAPLMTELLPDVPFTDRTWHQVELPLAHAGALTHPAFLLRFQTNRARASRFYQAFLCAPFVPPAGGLPAASEESARNPDLQERAGCKYCHAQLEPAAAHWGRWTEVGVGFLDPNQYPATHSQCLECAIGGSRCTSFCRNNYLTQALSEDERPYLGMLKAYAFRRESHMHYVEKGPKLLVRKAIAENQLPLCVARQTAEWLMGRTTTEADDAWIRDLATAFVHSGLRYKALVKAVVTSAQYRRVQ